MQRNRGEIQKILKNLLRIAKIEENMKIRTYSKIPKNGENTKFYRKPKWKINTNRISQETEMYFHL